VLPSEKPIWRGGLHNCGVVLGTNALVVLGFKVFHSSGIEVPVQCEPGEYYHWDGMSAQIYKKCASCIVCASVKGQGFRGKPPLVKIPVGGVFECVGVDFVELDLSSSGNRYALVFQDYLSKWPEVHTVSNRKAETVAECLLDLIWKHRVPMRIIHDRATEFLSNVLQETARLIGI